MVAGGKFLNDYVIGKNVVSLYTLEDTFAFQEKLYNSIVIKMMKSPQDIFERYFSSYAQNLQRVLYKHLLELISKSATAFLLAN